MKLGRYLLAIVVCLSIWGLPETTAAAQELRIGIPIISGYLWKAPRSMWGLSFCLPQYYVLKNLVERDVSARSAALFTLDY